MNTSRMLLTLSTLLLLVSSIALADTGDINIALNQPGTASGEYLNEIVANAFDGDIATDWNAGGYAGNWIEVDLGADTNIGGVRLMAAQVPNGGTVHSVTGRTESGDTVNLCGFSGYTTNFQWLENFEINSPIAVRYVRVTTTTTPSWVSWYEFEVYEGFVVASEEATFSGIKALYR